MSCINCAHRKHYIIIKVLFPLVRAEYTLGQKVGPNWMCLLQFIVVDKYRNATSSHHTLMLLTCTVNTRLSHETKDSLAT